MDYFRTAQEPVWGSVRTDSIWIYDHTGYIGEGDSTNVIPLFDTIRVLYRSVALETRVILAIRRQVVGKSGPPKIARELWQ